MDIFFADLSEVPVPPDEVRIRDFGVEPYPDGKRLRVSLEITPFQQRPNGEVIITDALGHQVAGVNIIEAIEAKMEMTLHLRHPERIGDYTARVLIFYTSTIDEITEGDQITALPERNIVDEMEITFSIED